LLTNSTRNVPVDGPTMGSQTAGVGGIISSATVTLVSCTIIEISVSISSFWLYLYNFCLLL